MSVGAPLLSPDEQVIHLQKSVSEGARDIDSLVVLLPKVIESGAWSSFTDQLGNAVEHDSFQSFVTTPRWKGLGVKSREALVSWVHHQDVEVSELVERAWRGEIPAARKRSGRPTTNESATPVTDVRDHTADSILARLKRDDPALAEQVVSGELSANAAAEQKGWRKPRILLTSPEHVATKLFDHWTAEQITELIELLQEGA